MSKYSLSIQLLQKSSETVEAIGNQKESKRLLEGVTHNVRLHVEGVSLPTSPSANRDTNSVFCLSFIPDVAEGSKIE